MVRKTKIIQRAAVQHKRLVHERGRRRSVGPVKADRQVTVMQITTHYNSGMQKSVSEHTTCQTFQRTGYSGRKLDKSKWIKSIEYLRKYWVYIGVSPAWSAMQKTEKQDCGGPSLEASRELPLSHGGPNGSLIKVCNEYNNIITITFLGASGDSAYQVSANTVRVWGEAGVCKCFPCYAENAEMRQFSAVPRTPHCMRLRHASAALRASLFSRSRRRTPS